MKNLFTSKKFIFSVVLFGIIFCILGLPFTNWGFKTDDWGNVQHGVLRSLKQFFALFSENSEAVINCSNCGKAEQAFFQGLFRPLSFVYYFFQYYLWGIKPYGYYLTTTFFHAANAVLLFNLFSLFAPCWYAWFAALFFGFHPSLWLWFGWTSAQTYYIELFFLLWIVVLLYTFLKTKKIYWYALACILFLCNLFLKEQTVFLPFWLVGAFYVIQKYVDIPYSSWLSRLWTSVKLSSAFWAISFFYIFVRLQFFPLTRHTATLTFEPTWESFITRFSARGGDVAAYVIDILGLSWLPYKSPYLKLSILFCIFFITVRLFWNNSQKGLILFGLASIPLFSWPDIVMHYQPRYLYMAIPWVLFVALVLIVFSRPWQGYFPRFIVRSMPIMMSVLIVFNACFVLYHLSKREKILHMITVAFQEIVQNPQINNRLLCFFSLPPYCFAFGIGTTQAVWLLKNDSSLPVYQYDYYAQSADGTPTTLTIDNCVLVQKSFEEFECRLKDYPERWFEINKCKTNSVTFNVNRRNLKAEPLFITWDYENNKFRILEYESQEA